MSNIYQCQIINLQLVRHRALKLKVGDTQPSLKTDLAVDPSRVKDLGWDVKDQEHKFDPSHVVDPPEEKQKSHPMQLR